MCSVEQVNPRQVERVIKKKWCTRAPGALAGTTTTTVATPTTPTTVQPIETSVASLAPRARAMYVAEEAA